jgi:hypothetical protein
MSQVNSISNIASSIDLGVGGSLQLRFAKLQLALSEVSKEAAMKEIEGIEKSQEEQKKAAGMLQEARQLQANAKAGTGDCSGDNYASYMPKEMQAYMDKNGLAYDKTGNDDRHNKDEWEVAINSLKAHLDQLGTNTQQKMVFVQDYMGQYNSYLQGANSAIQQSNQTLAELARAR